MEEYCFKKKKDAANNSDSVNLAATEGSSSEVVLNVVDEDATDEIALLDNSKVTSLVVKSKVFWVADSGATSHMVSDLSLLSDVKKVD